MLEDLQNSLGTHFSGEIITVFLECINILLFAQKLTGFKLGHTGIGYDIAFKIQYAFNIAQLHIQNQADAGRQRLQIPDMGNRRGKFDMTHSLTANFSLSNFNAALIANSAAVL